MLLILCMESGDSLTKDLKFFVTLSENVGGKHGKSASHGMREG